MMRKAGKSERTNRGLAAPQASNNNEPRFRGNTDECREIRKVKRNIICKQRSHSLNTFPVKMKPHYPRPKSSSQIEAIHLDPMDNYKIPASDSAKSNVSHMKIPKCYNRRTEMKLNNCDGKLDSEKVGYFPCEDFLTNRRKQEYRQTAEQLSSLENERSSQSQHELLWDRRNGILCKHFVHVQNVEVKNLLDQNRQVYGSPLMSRMAEYIPYSNGKGESSNDFGVQLTESHSSVTNIDLCNERNPDSFVLTRGSFRRHKLEREIHNLSTDEDDSTSHRSNLSLNPTESRIEISRTNNNDTDDDTSYTVSVKLSEETTSYTNLELKRSHKNSLGQNQFLYDAEENTPKYLYPTSSSPGARYTEGELSEEALSSDNHAMPLSLDYSYTLSSKSLSYNERGEDVPLTYNVNAPEDNIANKDKKDNVTGCHVSTEILNEYKKTAIEILLQRKQENDKRLAKESQKSERTAESSKTRLTENVVSASSVTKGKNGRKSLKSPKIKIFSDQKDRREFNSKRDNNIRNLKTSTTGSLTKTYGSTKDLTYKEKTKIHQSPQMVKRHPSITSRKSMSPGIARYKTAKGKIGISSKSDSSSRRALQDDISMLRNSSGEIMEASEKLHDPNPPSKHMCQNSEEENYQSKCDFDTQKREDLMQAELTLTNEEIDTHCPHLELIQGILKSPTAKAVQALGHFYHLLENSDNQGTEELTPEVDISVADILRKYKDILADNNGTSLVNTAADVSISENSQLAKAEEVICNSSFKIPSQKEVIAEGSLNRIFFDANKTGKNHEMTFLTDQRNLIKFPFDSGIWPQLADASKTYQSNLNKSTCTIEGLPLNSEVSSKNHDKNPEIIPKKDLDNGMAVIKQRQSINDSITSFWYYSRTPDSYNETSSRHTPLSSEVCLQAHLDAKDVLENVSLSERLQKFLSDGNFTQPNKSTQSYQSQQTIPKDPVDESIRDEIKSQPTDTRISFPKIKPSEDKSTSLSPSFFHLDSESSLLNNTTLPISIRSNEKNLEQNAVMNLSRNRSPKQPADNASHLFNYISTCEKACSPLTVMSDRLTESKRITENTSDITDFYSGKANAIRQMSLPDLPTSLEQQWNQFSLHQSPLLKRKGEREIRKFSDIYERNLSRFRPHGRMPEVVGKPCNDPPSSKLLRREVTISPVIRRSLARITAETKIQNLAKKKPFRKAQNELLQFTSTRKSEDEIIRESSSDELSRGRELHHSVYEPLKLDESKKKLCESIREKLKSKQMEAKSFSSKYWRNGSKPKTTHSFGPTTQTGISNTLDKEFGNPNFEHSREILPISKPKNKPKSTIGSDLSVLKPSAKAKITFQKAFINYLSLRKSSQSLDQLGNHCFASERRSPTKPSLSQSSEGLIKSDSTSQISIRSFTKDTVTKPQTKKGMMNRSKSSLKAPKEHLGPWSRKTIIQTGYDLQANHVPIQNISTQTMSEKHKSKTMPKSEEVESSEDDTTSSVRKKIVHKTCLKILADRRQQFELALAADSDSKARKCPASPSEYTKNMSQVNGSNPVIPKVLSQDEQIIRKNSLDETKTITDVPSITVNETCKPFNSSSHDTNMPGVDEILACVDTKTISLMKDVHIPRNSVNVGKRQKIQNIVTKNYRRGLRRTIVNEIRRKFELLKAIKDDAKSKDCSVSLAYKDRQEGPNSDECVCRTQSSFLLTEGNICLGLNSLTTEGEEKQHTDEVLTPKSMQLNVTGHSTSKLWTSLNAKFYAMKNTSCKRETYYINFHTTVCYIIACFLENARSGRWLHSSPKYKYLGELILPRTETFHNDISAMLSSLSFQVYGQKWTSSIEHEEDVGNTHDIRFKRVRESHREKGPPMKELMPSKLSKIKPGTQVLFSDDQTLERNCRTFQESWPFFKDVFDQITENDLSKNMCRSAKMKNDSDDSLSDNDSSPRFTADLNIPGEYFNGSHGCIQNTDFDFLPNAERQFEPFYSSLPLSDVFISIIPGRIVLLPLDVSVENRGNCRYCFTDDIETYDEGKIGPLISEINTESEENEIYIQMDEVSDLRKTLSPTDENQISKENPYSRINLASEEDDSRLSLCAFEVPDQVSSLNNALLTPVSLQEIQECTKVPNSHDDNNYHLTNINHNDEVFRDAIFDPTVQRASYCLEKTLNVLEKESDINFNGRKGGHLSARRQSFDQAQDSNVLSSISQGCNVVSSQERVLEEDLVETRKQSTDAGCDGATINTFLSLSEYEESIDSALKSLGCRKLNGNGISGTDKTCIADASFVKSNGPFSITNKMNDYIKRTTMKELQNYGNTQESYLSPKSQDSMGLRRQIQFKPLVSTDIIPHTEYTDGEICVKFGEKDEDSNSIAMNYELKPATLVLEKELQHQQNVSRPSGGEDERMYRNVSPLSMQTETSHKFSDASPSNSSLRSPQESNSIFKKSLGDSMTCRAESEELSSLVYRNINILATDIAKSSRLCNLKEVGLDHCDDSDSVVSMSSDCIDSVVAANERYFNDEPQKYISQRKKENGHELQHHSPTYPQDTVDNAARVDTSTMGRGCRSQRMLVKICPNSPKTAKDKGNKLKRRSPDGAEIQLLSKRSRISKDIDNSNKSGEENKSTRKLPRNIDVSNNDVKVGLQGLDSNNKCIRFSSTETQQVGAQCNELNHGLERVDVKESSLQYLQGKETWHAKECNLRLDNNGDMIKTKDDARNNSSKNRPMPSGECLGGDDKFHDSKNESFLSRREKNNMKCFREFAVSEHFMPTCDQNSKKKVKFFNYHPNEVTESGQSKCHFNIDQSLSAHNGYEDSITDDQELSSKSCSELDRYASFENTNLEVGPATKGLSIGQDHNGKRLTQYFHAVINSHLNNYTMDSNNHVLLSKEEDIQGELPMDFFPRRSTRHLDTYSTKNDNNRLHPSWSVDELNSQKCRKNICSSCEDEERVVSLGKSIEILKETSSETGSDTYGDVGSLVTEIVDNSSSPIKPDLRIMWSSGPPEQMSPFWNESVASEDKGVYTMIASCLVAALEHVLGSRCSRKKCAMRMKRLRRRKEKHFTHNNKYYFHSFDHRPYNYKGKKTIIRKQLSSPITRSRCRTYDTNTLAQVSSLPVDEDIGWSAAGLDNDTKVKDKYSFAAFESFALPQTNAQTSQCQLGNVASNGFEADFLNRSFKFQDHDQIRNHKERTSSQQCGYSTETKYCVADTVPEGDNELRILMSEQYRRDKQQMPHIDITSLFHCSSTPFRSQSYDCVSNNLGKTLFFYNEPYSSYSDYRPCTSDPIFCQSKELNEETKIKDIKCHEKSNCRNKSPSLSTKMKLALLSCNRSCQVGNNLLSSGNITSQYTKENERDYLFKNTDEMSHVCFKQEGKDLSLHDSATPKIIRSKSGSDIAHNFILKYSFHNIMQKYKPKPHSTSSNFALCWPEAITSGVCSTVPQKSQSENSNNDENGCFDINLNTRKSSTLDKAQSYTNIRQKTDIFVENSTDVENLHLVSPRGCNFDCVSVQISNPDQRRQCHASTRSTESTATEKVQESSLIHNVNRLLLKENLKQLAKEEILGSPSLQTNDEKQASPQQSLVKQVITKPFTQEDFHAEQLFSQGQSLTQENLKQLLPLKSSKMSPSQESSDVDLSKEVMTHESVREIKGSNLQDRNNLLLESSAHTDSQLPSTQLNDQQILSQEPKDMPLKQGNDQQILSQEPKDMPLKQGNDQQILSQEPKDMSLKQGITALHLTKNNIYSPSPDERIKKSQTHDNTNGLPLQNNLERRLMRKGDISLWTGENVEQSSSQRRFGKELIEKCIEQSLIKDSNEQQLKQYNVLVSHESNGTRTPETDKKNIEPSLSQKLINMSTTLEAFFQEPFKIENSITAEEIININQSLTIKKSDSFQPQNSPTWPFSEENTNQVSSVESFDETRFKAELRQSSTANYDDQFSTQRSTEPALSQGSKMQNPALGKPELALHKSQNTNMLMQNIADREKIEQMLIPKRTLAANERDISELSTLIPVLTHTPLNAKSAEKDLPLRNHKIQFTLENTEQSNLYDYGELPSEQKFEIRSINGNSKHFPTVTKQSSDHGYNGQNTQCEDIEHSMPDMDEKHSILQHKYVKITDAKESLPNESNELTNVHKDIEKPLKCKQRELTQELISQPLKIGINKHLPMVGNCQQQDDHKMSSAQLSSDYSSGQSGTLESLLQSSPQTMNMQAWNKFSSRHEHLEPEEHKKQQLTRDNLIMGSSIDENDKTLFINTHINVSETTNISRMSRMMTESVEEKSSQENLKELLNKESTKGTQEVESINKPLICQENAIQPLSIEENNEPITQSNDDIKASEIINALSSSVDNEKQLSIRERIEQLLKQRQRTASVRLPQKSIKQSLDPIQIKQPMCQGIPKVSSQRKDVKINFIQESTNKIHVGEELSRLNPHYSGIDYVNQTPKYLFSKTFQNPCINNTKLYEEFQLSGRNNLKHWAVNDGEDFNEPQTKQLPYENESTTRLKGFCMRRQRMGFQYRFHPYNISKKGHGIKRVNDETPPWDINSEYSSLLQSLSTRRNRRLVYPSQTRHIWCTSSAGGNSSTNWLSRENSISSISTHEEVDNENRIIEDAKRDMHEENVQSEFVQAHAGLENGSLSSYTNLSWARKNLRSKNGPERICNVFEVDNFRETGRPNTDTMIQSEIKGTMKNRNSEDNASSLNEKKLGGSMKNTTDNYFQHRIQDKTHIFSKLKKVKEKSSHVQEFTANHRPEQSLISGAHRKKALSVSREVSKQDVSLSCETDSDNFCNNKSHSSASSTRNTAYAFSQETQMSGFRGQHIGRKSGVRQQPKKKSIHQKSFCPRSCEAHGEQDLGYTKHIDNRKFSYSYSQFDHNIIENHKIYNNQGPICPIDEVNGGTIQQKNAQQCFISQPERNFSKTQEKSNKNLISSQSEQIALNNSSVEMVNGSPYEIVREFLSKKTRPVQIPVDIYPFPSKRTPKHKKTKTACGPRTMAISGPLVNLNIPVYHHESTLQQRPYTHESDLGNKSRISSETLNKSHEGEKDHQAKLFSDEDIANESHGFETRQGQFYTIDRSGPADIDYSSQSNQLVYHFTDKSPGIPKPPDFTKEDSPSRNRMRSFNHLRHKMKRMLGILKK